MDEKERKELEATNELDNHEEGNAQDQSTVTEPVVDVNHMEGQAREALHSNTSGEAPKPNNKIWPIISLVLAVLFVVALFKSPFAKSTNEAVATLDGAEITKDMLYDELVKTGGEAALNNLINQTIVDQAAKQKNITVTQAEVDERVKQMLEQYGSQEQLDQILQQYGMTMDNFKENLMNNLKITKLINPEVSDKEVSETFEQYKEQFNTPEQIRTSEIVVKTEDEAKAIVKELEGGKDFAELAKAKSLDTVTKEKGGDTDFYAKGQKDEAIETAAFKLAKDQVSAPVKTEEGYVVIKLTDRKEAHTATLDEKKDEIKRTLIGQKVAEKQEAWFADSKEKMKVENKLYPEKTDKSKSAASNTEKK